MARRDLATSIWVALGSKRGGTTRIPRHSAHDRAPETLVSRAFTDSPAPAGRARDDSSTVCRRFDPCQGRQQAPGNSVVGAEVPAAKQSTTRSRSARTFGGVLFGGVPGSVLAVVQPGADDGRHEDWLFLEAERPIEALGVVGL